jgi:preprotein translocase subunit SecE
MADEQKQSETANPTPVETVATTETKKTEKPAKKIKKSKTTGKSKNAPKHSKLVEILTTEYKWENLLLLFLVLAGIIISLLIITKVLTIDPSFPVLGEGNVGTIFSWVLFSISVLGLLVVIYPFILPSFGEFRKISWSKGREYWKNLTIVLVFLIVLTTVLALFDITVTQISKWITELRD